MNITCINRPLGALSVLGCMALAACGSSTELATTWTDPAAQPIHFQKTLVTFVSKDEATRRMIEDRLAARIPHGVPSYREFQSAIPTDIPDVRNKLIGDGFDGAVVMRVVDVSPTVAYVPGAYWYGTRYDFAGYWGNSWGYPYDPYVYVDQVVSVETQVYSLKDDKLIWAARSETTNPSSVKKLADSVIKHVVNAMQRQGLLAGASWILYGARLS